MPVWASAALISVLGITVVTDLTFGADSTTRLVAALVPPWQTGGLGAASGLAVVDLRWLGHVMILDTGGDVTALTRLRARGYWVMDATGVRACGEDEGPNDYEY